MSWAWFGSQNDSSVFRVSGEWRAASPQGFGEFADITDPLAKGISLPGARDMTVREMIGKRVRRGQRYGDWIEIEKQVADSHPDIPVWCRRNCNSELPSGMFRIAPPVWEANSDSPIDYPYVPELDETNRTLRELAMVERLRRSAAADLRAATARRNALIRAASTEGQSRRKLARLLGISFARVQQLVSRGES